jgi:alkylated DNA nucleotide flippase Atl1
MWPVKQAILEIVNLVPVLHVVSYGQLAPYVSERSGKTISAQMVWRQLSWMPEHEWNTLPRRRVVNKQWKISSLKLWSKWRKQIQLLESEWFVVNDNQIDMERYRWTHLDTEIENL